MLNNILVTVDFEKGTELLLNTALELAEKFGSKVWLLHIAAPDPDFVGYEVGPQYIRDIRAEELRNEHKKLQEYANNFREKEVEAEGLLITGATTEMILKESTELKVDLIITGHRKHGLLYKTFMGNTDIEIVEKSKVPVLLVPLPD